MIANLPGFTRQIDALGVTLTGRLGHIRYCERRRPFARMPAILARFAESSGGVAVGGIDHSLTAEGEQAEAGLVRAPACDLHVAAVYGDDFVDEIVASCRPEASDEMAGHVRFLAFHLSLGLGVSRRRVLHAGPPGWRERVRGLVSEWTPPASANPTMITVWPAAPVLEPLLSGPRDVLDDADPEPRSITGPHGVTGPLPGRSWRIVGGRRDGALTHRELVILEHGQYAYAVCIETPFDEHLPEARAALHDVVASITPFGPRRPQRRNAETVMFSCWAQ